MGRGNSAVYLPFLTHATLFAEMFRFDVLRKQVHASYTAYVNLRPVAGGSLGATTIIAL